MATSWRDIGNKLPNAGKNGFDALKATAEGVKNIAVGSGKSAGAAAGGMLGIANAAGKGTANAAVSLLNVGFNIIKDHPGIAKAIGALGIFAMARGIIARFKGGKKAEGHQAEVDTLRAQIEALKQARVATVDEIGRPTGKGTNFSGQVRGMPGLGQGNP